MTINSSQISTVIVQPVDVLVVKVAHRNEALIPQDEDTCSENARRRSICNHEDEVHQEHLALPETVKCPPHFMGGVEVPLRLFSHLFRNVWAPLEGVTDAKPSHL